MLLAVLVFAFSFVTTVSAVGLKSISGFTATSWFGYNSGADKRYGVGRTSADSPTTGKHSYAKCDLRDQWGSLISSSTVGGAEGPATATAICYDDPGNNLYITLFSAHEGWLNGVSQGTDFRQIATGGMK